MRDSSFVATLRKEGKLPLTLLGLWRQKHHNPLSEERRRARAEGWCCFFGIILTADIIWLAIEAFFTTGNNLTLLFVTTTVSIVLFLINFYLSQQELDADEFGRLIKAARDILEISFDEMAEMPLCQLRERIQEALVQQEIAIIKQNEGLDEVAGYGIKLERSIQMTTRFQESHEVFQKLGVITEEHDYSFYETLAKQRLVAA